jgi:phage gp36-like protein
MANVPTQQYAQVADLANLGLSPQALSVISTQEQNAALLTASAYADGCLNAQFVLPLKSWGVDLTRAVALMAAYDLLSQRGFSGEGSDENIRKRYQDAQGWFDKVAQNKIVPVVVDSSVNPNGAPAQAQGQGFSFSVGAPINQPDWNNNDGSEDSMGFWNNGISSAFSQQGGGGTTRGF